MKDRSLRCTATHNTERCSNSFAASARSEQMTGPLWALSPNSLHSTRMAAVGKLPKLCKLSFLRIAADRADRSELPLSAQSADFCALTCQLL